MRNKFIGIFVAAILASQANALPIEDIHVGAVYYHNAWNNNNKVQVLGVRGNSVKVQFLEGSNVGAIEFVPPADLLTPSQSSEEAWGDVGEALFGSAIVLCALFGCEGERSSGSSGSRLSDSSSKDYSINVHNRCSKNVKVAVSYFPSGSNTLDQVSWWTFKPGQKAFLVSDEKRLKTKNSVTYYYAESTDNSLVWRGEDSSYPKISVRASEQIMRKIIDKKGDTEIVLNCD